MRTPPYNTGKVMIGSHYEYPLQNNMESYDSQLWQAVLLNTKEDSKPMTLLKQFIRFVA